MKRIALIVALDTERDALLAVLEGLQEERSADGQVFYVGRLGDASLEVIVAQSGIGKVNAAMCAASLIDRFRPDAVINTVKSIDAVSLGRLDDAVVSVPAFFVMDVIAGELHAHTCRVDNRGEAFVMFIFR